MQAENDLLSQNVKEERAARAISELQDRLTEARNDRKDMEIEFIALKKNYYQVKQDLDEERLKRENQSIELINLVNENKALDNRLGNDQRIKGMNDQSYEFQQAKFQKQEYELQESRENLLRAQEENNNLKYQIQQLMLSSEKGNVDVGNRKMELERQFLEM